MDDPNSLVIRAGVSAGLTRLAEQRSAAAAELDHGAGPRTTRNPAAKLEIAAVGHLHGHGRRFGQTAMSEPRPTR